MLRLMFILILLFVAIVLLLAWSFWRFEQEYRRDVKAALQQNKAHPADDDSSTQATFTNEGVSVQATLYFNATGQLVNFVSDDRYAVSDMQRYRFSTPVADYKNFNGFNVMSFGQAVWHYPDGEFVYGKFELQEIVYNVAPF